MPTPFDRRRRDGAPASTPTTLSPDPILGDHLEAEGAARPSLAKLPADHQWRGMWELTRPAPNDTLFFLGAHGGSGSSTLTALAQQRALHGVEARQWPFDPRWASTEHPSSTAAVVVVARTHAHGLDSAIDLIGEWDSGAVYFADVLGVVLVADAPGTPPKAIADKIATVAALVPKTWTIGWQPEWRALHAADPHPLSARTKVTLGRIKRALGKHARHQTDLTERTATTKGEF